jgi:hypothetical protein
VDVFFLFLFVFVRQLTLFLRHDQTAVGKQDSSDSKGSSCKQLVPRREASSGIVFLTWSHVGHRTLDFLWIRIDSNGDFISDGSSFPAWLLRRSNNNDQVINCRPHSECMPPHRCQIRCYDNVRTKLYRRKMLCCQVTRND